MNALKFLACILIIISLSCCKKVIRDSSNPGTEKNKSLSPSAKTVANEDYKIFSYQNQLWCRYYRNNQGIFDFRIGAGGAMSELRWVPAGYAALISPSYAGEQTDRIIQTTWWDHNLKSNTSAPDKRWNVTQGGNKPGTFSPIHKVQVDTANHIIDVYSYPRDQWATENAAAFSGGYKMLSRYEGLANGVVKIRRVMIAQQAYYYNTPVNYSALYVEAWTPFRYPAFNGLALSFDNAGNPNWWYKRTSSSSSNIPYYPGFAVNQTNGYGVVYKDGQLSSQPFSAFIYGTQQPGGDVLGGSHALNSMSWNTGIAVLPALQFGTFPVQGIIDRTFYLYTDIGFNASTVSKLNQLVSQLPQTKVYSPGSALPADLSTIVQNINTYTASGGARTQNLGQLATGL